MPERRYSLSEIDEMREAVAKFSIWTAHAFKQHERNLEIEARLRTYMQNGSDPDELCEALRVAYGERQRLESERRRAWRESEAGQEELRRYEERRKVRLEIPATATTKARRAWW